MSPRCSRACTTAGSGWARPPWRRTRRRAPTDARARRAWGQRRCAWSGSGTPCFAPTSSPPAPLDTRSSPGRPLAPWSSPSSSAGPTRAPYAAASSKRSAAPDCRSTSAVRGPPSSPTWRPATSSSPPPERRCGKPSLSARPRRRSAPWTTRRSATPLRWVRARRSASAGRATSTWTLPRRACPRSSPTSQNAGVWRPGPLRSSTVSGRGASWRAGRRCSTGRCTRDAPTKGP